ncbi:OmpA family protein [uncultured Lacinutrix sp.]|uniref:OmpA family protein n=1 Tax=uncultured Lacinutrix sp. TaxID=574032 RepID=UPI002639D92F|nr:OmpA family protein [uncultured Lacinutrix sp.]
MKYKITLFFIFLITVTNSQNLVKNPSFEDYKKCPTELGAFHDNVMCWSCSNYGSTDYFNNCNNDLGYFNYVGNQTPRTGKGYAGIYAYAPNSYREYIQTKFINKLVKGTEYIITFYVSLSDCSSHAVNTFGILFTETKLDHASSNFIHLKYLNRDKIKYNFISVMDNTFYSNTQEWIKISTIYKAKGYENYLSIGNFDVNRKIVITNVWPSAERQFAYYYIDDISIIDYSNILKEKTIEIDKEKKVEEDILLETEKIHVFKNVLFDFNKSTLLKDSVEDLDKLYLHLSKNSNLFVEIYGHTDNIGLQRRNQELSTKRAKAVSDYLILKGLNSSRIQWFGFGSTKPILKNNSEENRAQNRRVEFKLISK